MGGDQGNLVLGIGCCPYETVVFPSDSLCRGCFQIVVQHQGQTIPVHIHHSFQVVYYSTLPGPALKAYDPLERWQDSVVGQVVVEEVDMRVVEEVGERVVEEVDWLGSVVGLPVADFMHPD